MATLINRFQVHDHLVKMIDEAERQLILISPYIKLHPEYKKALDRRINDHMLKITVIFGKNIEDISKSLSFNDFDYFSKFPNIQIRYCERLHAKIYANDMESLVTSMNLHKFSAEQNIEVGILCQNNLLDDLKDLANVFTNNLLGQDSLDAQVVDFIAEIIKYSPRVYFEKTPNYDKGIVSNKYIGSTVKVTPEAFRALQAKPTHAGYCIRTGTPIAFNVKKPYSDVAYDSWNKFKNEEYKEKYCHFSGEQSSGETCFKRPILSKNWRSAKKVWNF